MKHISAGYYDCSFLFSGIVNHVSRAKAERYYVTSQQNYVSLIIIIIRHRLGLDRPFAASYNGLLKGLPSRFRPFGL